jgi:hypothetical protein
LYRARTGSANQCPRVIEARKAPKPMMPSTAVCR